MKRYDPELRSKALARLAAGEKVGKIAKELGINLSAVSSWRKAAGLPSVRKTHKRGSNGAKSPERSELVRSVGDHRIEMALSCLREYRKNLEEAAGARYSRNDHYAMLALSWLEGKR